jgi:hypothetical protein
MADTLTVRIQPDAAASLRRAADESGETVEALAARLLEEAAGELDPAAHSQLTVEQIEEVRRRMADPGPFATAEEVETFFARFTRA